MKTKTCGECKYFSKYENKCCLLVGRGVTYADSDGCMSFVQKLPKVITNGDRIHQMSNDDFAEFFTEPKCGKCIYYDRKNYGSCNAPADKTCADGIEAWLDAPAESEGEKDED